MGAILCSIYLPLFANMIPSLYLRVTHDPKQWTLIFGDITVMDVRQSAYFDLIWCYQVIICVSFGTMYVCSDMLLSSIFVEISFRFVLLQKQFKNIVHDCKIKEPGVSVPFVL